MRDNHAAAVDDRLATLFTSYGVSLPEKLARLQEAGRLASLCRDWQTMQPLLREIRSTGHMLAGSAPTFGYQAVGEMARTAERLAIGLIDANAMPMPPRLAELQGVLAVLAGSLQAPAGAVARSRLAVLAAPEGIGREVARQLQRQGCTVTLIENIAAIRTMSADLSLHAILAETSRDGFGPADWLTTLRKRRLTEVPTVFFGEAGDFDARHAAVRAGAVGYLQDPLRIPDLPAQLETMIAPEAFRPYRVLTVGDGMPSPDGPGLLCRNVADPGQLLTELENFRPELLLLSLMMTTYDAIDLARLVWQHERYAEVGIFFAAANPIAGPTLLSHGITDAYCLSGPLDPVTMRARIVRYLVTAQVAGPSSRAA